VCESATIICAPGNGPKGGFRVIQKGGDFHICCAGQGSAAGTGPFRGNPVWTLRDAATGLSPGRPLSASSFLKLSFFGLFSAHRPWAPVRVAGMRPRQSRLGNNQQQRAHWDTAACGSSSSPSLSRAIKRLQKDLRARLRWAR